MLACGSAQVSLEHLFYEVVHTGDEGNRHNSGNQRDSNTEIKPFHGLACEPLVSWRRFEHPVVAGFYRRPGSARIVFTSNGITDVV